MIAGNGLPSSVIRNHVLFVRMVQPSQDQFWAADVSMVGTIGYPSQYQESDTTVLVLD